MSVVSWLAMAALLPPVPAGEHVLTPANVAAVGARRGELGENITKLLEEVPRATSAPPHLQERWGPVRAGCTACRAGC